MSREDWCYVSGLVAAMETRLLRTAFFDKVVEVFSPEELLAYLGDTELEEEFQGPPDLANVEAQVERFGLKRMKEIRSFCPRGAVVDLFLCEADFLNFKAVGKNVLLGLSEPFSAAGTVPKETFERIWRGEETDDGVWGDLAGKVMNKTEGAEERAFLIDLIVDSAHLRFVEERGQEVESDLARAYVRGHGAQKRAAVLYRARCSRTPSAQIAALFLDEKDTWMRVIMDAPEAEMMAVLRLALPGRVFEAFEKSEPEGRASALERAGERELMALAKEAKGVAYGPEPVLGYLSGLNAEIGNLKLAVGGIMNKLPAERIRPKLRALYVE